MKKLLAYVRIGIIDAFEYRIDVLGFVVSGLARPIVLLCVWLVVLLSNNSVPATRNELIQYYLLLLLISPVVSAWAGTFVARDIRSGKISPLIIKPFPFIFTAIGNNIGEKVIKLSYLIPLVALLFLLFGQSLPKLSFPEIIIFCISLFMAASLNFLINMCVGLSAFWTDDANSLEDFVDLVYYIFSGKLFPLALLPIFWQQISDILPFRYILSLPIEILQQNLDKNDLTFALGMQAFWLLFFIVLYKLMWSRGLKRYSAFAN